jgi:hypothetical protein
MRARLQKRSHVGSEAGFAVPIVMLVMLAGFGLASVTVVASVGSQKGTVVDERTKQAIGVAEAGVSEALLHYNRIPTNQTGATCLVGVPVASATPVNGWCTGQTRALAGTGETFTYWVKPDPVNGVMEVVSQGISNGVERRVSVVARSSGGLQPFGSASVIGLNGITLDSNAQIQANVATNGDIDLDSNAVIACNYASVGPGHVVSTSSNAQFNCPGPTQTTVSLPPVNQGNVPTVNNNNRICTVDRLSDQVGQTCPSIWNPTARRLSIGGNSTMTLGTGGGEYNYSFCSLHLDSNAAIYIDPAATVRIYFDSPEACGLANGAKQLRLLSNSRIAPTSSSPIHVALLFVGSPTLLTKIELNSNTQANAACEQDYVIYAPRTDVKFDSNAYYCGAIAARSIELSSNSRIRTSNQVGEFELPNTVNPHYAAEEFVECSALATTSVPDSGC